MSKEKRDATKPERPAKPANSSRLIDCTQEMLDQGIGHIGIMGGVRLPRKKQPGCPDVRKVGVRDDSGGD